MIKKIVGTLVSVNKAKVADLTSLKGTMEKFIAKNIKEYAKVANDMKKADKVYVKASKANADANTVSNAYYFNTAKAALDSCVEAYNEIAKNINESMESVKRVYEDLNAAVAVVDPEKAANQAEDFNKYNEKISKELKKINDSLAGYPHY